MLRRSAAAVLAFEASLGAAVASLVLARFTVHAGSDFAVYYAGARALRLAPGADIYQWAVIQASMPPVGGCWLIPSPFVYPPLLAIVLEPLTLLPCNVAIYVWQILNALLLGGALYLMSRIWPLALGTFALLCAATLMSFPLLMGLFFGQIHILIFFGLVVAMWRYAKGDTVGAGAAIAVVAWIQVIPGLFAIYFLLRREWRALTSMLATGALLLLGMIWLAGPQWLPQYLQSVDHTYAINRMSLNASLVFLLGPWVAVLALALYGGLLWWRRGDNVVGFFWTIATMILVSPIAWPYFLLWLFPALLRWWLGGTRWQRVLLGVAYLALFFSKDVQAIQAIFIIGVWLALGWEYLRAVSTPPPAPEGSAANAPHGQPRVASRVAGG